MSNMKLWALAYAKLGWPVFRITGYKTPLKGSHGHLDATTDPAVIERWWTEKPNANIAVALGDIVVIDADGPGALARLKGILAAHNWVPDTAIAATSRGRHLYFRAPPGVHIRTRNEPRQKSGDDGIDIKAHGGWTVLPPSVNAKSKFQYKWLHPLPISELPDWLIPALVPNEVAPAPRMDLGPLPEYLKNNNTKNITQAANESLQTIYSASEHSRITSALSTIPANSYDIWFQVGMALKTLDWQRSDGSDIGFDLFDQWSQTCPEKYSLGGTEDKWRSFGRRSGITLGTIFHLANQFGWSGGAPSPAGVVPPAAANHSPDPSGKPLNGHPAPVQALPAAFMAGQQAIFFPDMTEEHKIRSTMLNAKVAIGALGIDCRYDLFHNRMLVAGELINKWNSTELSDHVATMLRDIIRSRYGFDPNKQNVQDACEALCLNRRFDPVLDYLDGLQWDGQPRLDRWLATYMGAADTELNRAVSRLSLIAAVRRVRAPGTKFDQIIVLEGHQGQGKSEAVEILAGADNFSDQSILNVDDRKQQELTEGVWLYEIGELSGLRKADVEHVKAFASRKRDRARPAYGRYVVTQQRRTVFFASSNRTDYLQDDTGNRRFWPVAVSFADHAALRRDRDQLWAEAATREAKGESHVLPESLWATAAEEQQKRMTPDSWVELIHKYLNMPDKPKSDVSVTDVLCDNQFIQMRPDAMKQSDTIKAGRVLHHLGFHRYQTRLSDGTRMWRYKRPD